MNDLFVIDHKLVEYTSEEEKVSCQQLGCSASDGCCRCSLCVCCSSCAESCSCPKAVTDPNCQVANILELGDEMYR